MSIIARVVYLVAMTLVGAPEIETLKSLGYMVEEVDDYYMIRYWWPEGHESMALPDKPGKIVPGGEFIVHVTLPDGGEMYGNYLQCGLHRYFVKEIRLEGKRSSDLPTVYTVDVRALRNCEDQFSGPPIVMKRWARTPVHRTASGGTAA